MIRLTLLFIAASVCQAADWPQFRGPNGDGHYSGSKLPVEWGPDTNVAWKVKIPGKGWSSPIVSKGKIYLTTAEPAGKGLSLRAICIDVESGKIDWNVEAIKSETAPAAHSKNSQASPTPVTDGERIYVHFGHLGTAALDLKGKVIWKVPGKYQKPVHGNGGSPILANGRLIFSCDGIDKQAVVALNVKDGSTAWDVPRKSKAPRPFSFSTPAVAEYDDKSMIVSVGSDVVLALDPASGKELWRCRFSGYSVIPQPAVGNGYVYVATGFDTSNLKAIQLGGSGDVTASHVTWTQTRGAPNTPSPLLKGDELYVVSDWGMFSCVDAKKGDVVWSERLKGNYSASPLYADGKIYVTSEEGKGTLLAAGRKKDLLGEFDMKEKTFASFTAADGALYVRTETQLYKFTQR